MTLPDLYYTSANDMVVGEENISNVKLCFSRVDTELTLL